MDALSAGRLDAQAAGEGPDAGHNRYVRAGGRWALGEAGRRQFGRLDVHLVAPVGPLAVELRQKYKMPQINTLLGKHAAQLLQEGKLPEAIEMQRMRATIWTLPGSRISIFSRYDSKDNEVKHVSCYTCETPVADCSTLCPSCGNRFPPCIASGQLPTSPTGAWQCSGCCHVAHPLEMTSRKTRPPAATG
uniref:IFT121-like zinc finger domain-containing protein n=1 Tax=Anopheles atroparvus TaxID=41427 RepID=A0A182JMK3_ANOAO